MRQTARANAVIALIGVLSRRGADDFTVTNTNIEFATAAAVSAANAREHLIIDKGRRLFFFHFGFRSATGSRQSSNTQRCSGTLQKRPSSEAVGGCGAIDFHSSPLIQILHLCIRMHACPQSIGRRILAAAPPTRSRIGVEAMRWPRAVTTPVERHIIIVFV